MCSALLAICQSTGGIRLTSMLAVLHETSRHSGTNIATSSRLVGNWPEMWTGCAVPLQPGRQLTS
jgi:hypothetical protein